MPVFWGVTIATLQFYNKTGIVVINRLINFDPLINHGKR